MKEILLKTWITLKPNARKESVEALPDGSLRLSVRAPAVEEKANDAVVELLARHFGVSKSMVRIVMGGRGKLVEVA